MSNRQVSVGGAPPEKRRPAPGVWLVVAAMAVTLTVCAVNAADGGGGSSAPGAALHRKGCGRALTAFDEYARDVRSAPSALAELQAAQEDLRNAAVLSSRWEETARLAAELEAVFPQGPVAALPTFDRFEAACDA